MLSHKIGLGTVQFGLPYGISNTNGQTSSAEVKSILNLAIKNGINCIDTASAYGNAEQVLGENDLKPFRIVSKYISPTKENPLNTQLQNTLSYLKVEKLYAYLAHRPTEILADNTQWEILKEKKSAGFMEKIGFSLNDPSELSDLLDAGFLPDIIQVPYNFIDNRFEKQMIDLKSKGCEIHTRSAFLQGLFFKNVDSLPVFFDAVKPLIKDIQNQTKYISGSLLNFVLAKPFVDKVIIGVENTLQLQNNLNDLSYSVNLVNNTGLTIPKEILMPSNWPQ
jgi:aryl-alcohol dehydrogenase-like predicted oxidoreductase